MSASPIAEKRKPEPQAFPPAPDLYQKFAVIEEEELD